MTTDYRVERDSMGELEVPSDALWGAQTQRAVDNFPISGLRMPRQFIRALGLIKWAAARTNKDLELLPAALAVAIETGLRFVYANFAGDEGDELGLYDSLSITLGRAAGLLEVIGESMEDNSPRLAIEVAELECLRAGTPSAALTWIADGTTSLLL